MSKPIKETINLMLASVVAYIIIGIVLYLGLNYKRNGIYDTVFTETMLTLALVIAGGLVINFFLLRFSVHQSKEDKERKKNNDN